MTDYFLDTNVAIAVMNGRPLEVSSRLAAAVAAGSRISLSSIVVFELWYGVAKSARKDQNSIALRHFLAGGLTLLAFDEEDARHAGEVRAWLAAKGRPIGPYDVLIAGQAVRHKAALVSANTREFRRVPGLALEDWSRRP